MSVILLLLQLAGVAVAANSSQECAAECQAVLRAAGEWAKSMSVEQRGAVPGRLLLDIDLPSSRALTDSAAQQRRQFLTPMGSALGLPLVRRSGHGAWEACQRAPHAAVCRDASGTGYISLEGPRFLSESEALVHAYLLVLKRSSVGWSTLNCQLRLSRSPDGVWSVDEERVCIVS